MGGGESLIYKMVKIPACLYAYGDDPVGDAVGTVGQNRETSDVLEKTGRVRSCLKQRAWLYIEYIL